MTHTVENLLKLADAYHDCAINTENAREHRAALQSALTEVLAELASAKATIEYQSETWHIQDACITSLQSKCDEQARELEARKAYADEQTDFAIKNANERDTLAAKVAEMEKQEPVAYLHPTLPKAISLPDLLEQSHHIQLEWTKGARLYLAPGAAQKEPDMPKIGCVQHDCDECKAMAQQPATAQRLSDAECAELIDQHFFPDMRPDFQHYRAFRRAIETAFAEKNGIALEQKGTDRNEPQLFGGKLDKAFNETL